MKSRTAESELVADYCHKTAMQALDSVLKSDVIPGNFKLSILINSAMRIFVLTVDGLHRSEKSFEAIRMINEMEKMCREMRRLIAKNEPITDIPAE